jgi:uncharacterized protein with von Willebrand factor type A (vWA) domain
MNTRENLGGIIHIYQKFDPIRFPSPTADPPDMLSPAFNHLLIYGNIRQLTEEELARAVHLDPSQIAGLGPSLDAIRAILEERKRKILSTYETARAEREARQRYGELAQRMKPPARLAGAFQKAVREEQLRDLERLWYAAGDERGKFARDLLLLTERLGEKYQVDELAARYEFTGHTPMSVPKALEVKQELELIDKLLQQLEEAAQTAQVGIIDPDELARFVEPGDMEQLNALQQQVQDLLRELAERQGLQGGPGGYQLTPKAYRLFQSRLLTEIFNELQASRTGRHQGPIVGEGAVEMQQTKTYEFGDSVTHMDIPASLLNALLRSGPALPIRLKTEDIEIHRTRNNPRCATAVLLDMSGSMRYDAQYVNVKRLGLALDGLIRTEFPGDSLKFIEMFTFARLREVSEIAELLPKPVTLYNPVVHVRIDMSDPRISEVQLPPHFTNIQHALQLGRQYLSVQDTPNRQIVLITDGLPTAHFEEKWLFLLYPPNERTEAATLREGHLCARAGITINIFLLNTWNQSSEDVRFAYRLAESTRGRVFFTAGRELDRFVIWDYIKRRKLIIG